MNFKYLYDIPTIPQEIIEEIYQLIENPIGDHNDPKEVYLYKTQEIASRPDLQLSSVNQDLLDTFSNYSHDHEDSLGYPISQANVLFNDLAKFDFLKVSDNILEWTYVNISPKPALVTIQVMHNGPTIIPHVDEGRTFVYNYLLDTGGATTRFYKNAKGYEHLTAYPQTVFTYDRIEVIETIDIEPNRWHYLDVTKVHNVENIQPGRKRISLSLSYV
jgi:hypothetical protein